MRFIPTIFGAAILAGLVLAPEGRSLAQGRDPTALRKAQSDYASLQEQLARVNAEIAELKRADHSVRGDYRLRERMADAQALAQKLSQAEAQMRALEAPPAIQPWTATPPPPQESPQDGSVELEAKADLFADQAARFLKQANLLSHAAEQLRMRKALRQRAAAWDRDPFAGLETSKRSLAASVAPSTTRAGVGSSGTGDTGSKSGTQSTQPLLPVSTTTGASPTGSFGAPSGAGTASAPLTGAGAAAPSDSAPRTATPVGSGESPTSKTSPLAPSLSADHPAEQRLFLDPAMAAEVRQALLGAGGTTDANALDRAAAVLRARARELGQRAETLRRKSQAP